MMQRSNHNNAMNSSSQHRRDDNINNSNHGLHRANSGAMEIPRASRHRQDHSPAPNHQYERPQFPPTTIVVMGGPPGGEPADPLRTSSHHHRPSYTRPPQPPLQLPPQPLLTAMLQDMAESNDLISLPFVPPESIVVVTGPNDLPPPPPPALQAQTSFSMLSNHNPNDNRRYNTDPLAGPAAAPSPMLQRNSLMLSDHGRYNEKHLLSAQMPPPPLLQQQRSLGRSDHQPIRHLPPYHMTGAPPSPKLIPGGISDARQAAPTYATSPTNATTAPSNLNEPTPHHVSSSPTGNMASPVAGTGSITAAASVSNSNSSSTSTSANRTCQFARNEFP